MRLTGIGSQYLLAMTDADKNYFDGAKTYKVTLPKDIPEANFWSFTVYDNQTRSMLDTPQRYPRAGSQSFPSPAAEADADGSTTVFFGPSQPAGVKWQTGFKPTRQRAGSRSCVSTARSNRSSPRRGVRARSNRFGEDRLQGARGETEAQRRVRRWWTSRDCFIELAAIGAHGSRPLIAIPYFPA